MTISETIYYHLRAINSTDIESLRLWKNANKEYFFHAEDIAADQQLAWYERFIQRSNDHMFVVEELVGSNRRKIGCMGYRVKGSVVDVYNIMRGQPSLDNKFTMGQAFLLMTAYAAEREQMSVTCVVLKSNPALNWYAKNGFKVMSDQGDSLLLQLDGEFLKSKKILVKVMK